MGFAQIAHRREGLADVEHGFFAPEEANDFLTPENLIAPSGRLPLKAAPEFERFCRAHGELLDELGTLRNQTELLTSFRLEQYAESKANRSATRPEFSGQVPLIKEVLNAFRVSGRFIVNTRTAPRS